MILGLYVDIMEKKRESTVIGYLGFKVKGLSQTPG